MQRTLLEVTIGKVVEVFSPLALAPAGCQTGLSCALDSIRFTVPHEYSPKHGPFFLFPQFCA